MSTPKHDDHDRTKELEQPETWDFERAERRPGGRAGRAIVSVAFARDDFSLVAEAAHQFGMKTSELIRESTLERVRQRTQRSTLVSYTGNPGWVIFADHPISHTQVSGRTEVSLNALEQAHQAVTI